ncbi:MAG: PrsW family glutamic-type intramembrane protease [Candidatus Pacebacteria bacterium]|nr:PrsW family glutamic-type intramembrane protease [Candidatus Paceibacterota bacterium]
MNYLYLILGLIPSFAWLIFYLKEDPHPEPKKVIFFAFLAGALSTFVALGLQLLFNDLISKQNIARYGTISFLGLAVIEEFLKFGAAFIVIKKFWKEFDEPIDAMIYMVVAALGFATIENVAAAAKLGASVFETTTLRFIGATLLHTLSSGLLGYYWARSILDKKRVLLAYGLIFASILHAIFNLLILKFEPLFIPTAFLIFYAFFILYDFEKLKQLS